MTTPIHIGDRGKTLGPLKPTGRVRVNGREIDASSEGGWVDPNAEVIVIGGNLRRAMVRELSCDEDPPENHGEPLPEEQPLQTTPLQSPAAWVEQINSIMIGAVIGIVLIPCAWLAGTPFDWSGLLVPVSGAVAGWLFRMFVATASQTVGPREDHRPLARSIALIVLGCSIVGAAIGLNLGLGFLGICCGLPLGAFVGGTLAYVGWIVSHFV